jgi:photosystem II stability/assembly factor-like uncharacterized protein
MNDLVFTPNKMIASTNKGIFYSIDGGVNWVSSNQGMTNADTTGLGTFQIFKTNTGRIITSAISGAYYSDNNGQNWINSASGSYYACVVQTNSNLIASDAINIYVSNDNGTTWQTTSNTGIAPADLSQIVNLVYLNNSVYAGGSGIGVYKSTDNGNTWQANNNGMSGVFYGNLLQLNNKLFKGVYQQGIFELNLTSNTWQLSSFAQNNINTNITGYNNGRYFGGINLLHDGLRFTDNNGQTWQNCNGVKCMNIRKLSSSENLYSLYDAGGYLFDSTQTIFNRTTPFNQNYSANTYFQSGVFDIKKRSNGTIYLATAGGVWKSTNNGASYTQSYNGLPQTGTVITVYQVNDLFVSGTFPNDTLFAATDNGIYFSTNDAQTFSLCTGTSGAKMQQFLKYNGTLYCAGTKIFKHSSPNNWTQFTTFASTGILGFAATDGYLFVASANSPIRYAPTNGSANFAAVITSPIGSYNSNSVAAYDTLLFFRNQNGVYKINTSTMGSTQPNDVIQIADNLPYYLNSSNNKQFTYIGGSSGFGMAIFNGKLWLGTNGMSTFYRSLADFGYDITVGEKAPNNEKIKSSGVVFPNPTKDKLTITDLAQGSQLTIYNSIGQLVVQLSNSQSQTIDISKLEKGIYTYSIINNKQNEISSGKFIKE